MGKIMTLSDVTITDTSAPRIPHRSGVAGSVHRYIADHINQDLESTVSSWGDVVGTAALTARFGASQVKLKQHANGYRYVDTSGTVAGAGQLWNTNGTHAAPATLALVVAPQATAVFADYGGYQITRGGNGALGIRGLGNAGNSGGPAVAVGAWAVVVASINPAGTTTVNVNGTEFDAPSLTGPQNPAVLGVASYQDAVGAQFAEAIVWSRALNATERASVVAALKSRYKIA